MIDCFWGEFLIHPAPLELSGNKCSHDCAYCFANIQRQDRYSGIDETIRFFKRRNHKTLPGVLFERGYPVCLSNRTDPFAKSIIKESLVLARMFADVPNGLFIQTKGGDDEDIDSFIQNLDGKKNIVWYVTITTPRADVAKIVEPNAPSPEKRKELAVRLKEAGYPVIVAFNPFVNGWTTVEENLSECDWFASQGINHFIYQNLHLNMHDINGFSDKRISAFRDTKIETEKYATKKRAVEEQRYMQGAIIEGYKRGYHSLAFGMPLYTRFFDECAETYEGKMFPSNYFFYNWVIDNKNPGDIVTFEDYYNALSPGHEDVFEMPFSAMQGYIYRTARQVWKGNKEAQECRTYKKLLEIIWKDKRMSGSPRNFKLFSVNSENEVVFNGALTPQAEGERNEREKGKG
jgi:DNA repair photolyase